MSLINDVPLVKINKVKFYVLTPRDIANLSQVEVKNHLILQGNKPYDNGVYDLHMGSTDLMWECRTCKFNNKHCLGHYGSYNLKTYIFNPLFMQTIYWILKNICITCGSITNKKTKCESCGNTIPLILHSKTDKLVILMNKKILLPLQVYNIFSNISQDTSIKLGFPKAFHPTHLLLKTMLGPPNTIRPDMQFIMGKNSSNDITILFQAVVRLNNSLPNITEDILTDELIKNIIDLNIAVYELMKGPYSNTPIPGKHVYTGALMNQIPSKEGIIRKRMLGKNVRYMGRAIIACKADLHINEIGIPLFHAKRLQKKEYVRDYNYDKCLIYFLNGTNKYPGSTRIKQLGKSYFVSVDFINSSYNLKIGDIIFRDLIDGDIVNFNRQPTLDRSSISSMKVKIFQDINVFFMNVSSCSLFNADFDGDQMNIQVPYSTFTENEIDITSNIDKTLISIKNTKIQISEVLDASIGLTMLTYNDYMYDNGKPRFLRNHFLNLCNIPLIIDDTKKNMTGKDLITSYFKTKKIFINYNGKSALSETMTKINNIFQYSEDMLTTKIINGEFINGILDKPSIGEGERNNIFHKILNQHNYQKAIDAIFDLQQMALTYIAHYEGYTISLRDIYVNETCRKILNEITNSVINNCNLISQNYRNNLLVAPIGVPLRQYYESLLINQMESKDIALLQLFKHTTRDNNLFMSIASGVKGKIFNYKNIKGSIELVTVGDSLIPEDFGYGRTTGYTTRFDTNIISKAYIPESYITGTNPLSFFFHTIDSRYAIIMKALATSESGTRQRQDRKCFETYIINNNLQVSSNNYMLQPLYGKDGIFPSFYEEDNIHILNPKLTNKEFEEKYNTIISVSNNTSYKDQIKDPIINKVLIEEYNYLFQLRKKYIKTINYKCNTPSNVNNIINDIILLGSESGKLDIIKVIDTIKLFIENLHYIYFNEYYVMNEIPIHIKDSLEVIKIYLLSYLNTSTIIKYGLNNKHIDCVLQQILFKMKRSIVRYGTPIGSLVTMCINEPLMQKLLDSHHFVGTSGGKKKGVINEVNDLFSIRDTTDSAIMKIYYNNDIQFDKYKVEKITFDIKVIKMKDICKKYQIINESPGTSDNKEENEDYEQFKKITNLKPYYAIVPLCIKLFIDNMLISINNISLEQIYLKLISMFPDFYIIYNSRFKDTLYFKMFYYSITLNDSKIQYTLYSTIQLIENEILEINIKGINNIITANVKEEIIQEYNEKEGNIIERKIYYTETVGSNLIDIYTLNYIDKYKTTTDNVLEVYEIFGVIGARNKILEKLNSMITVDIKHTTIYADLITVTGQCTSIDRYGSNDRDESPLTQMSDASPINVVIKAALNRTTNVINNPSDAILLGQIPKLGTNYNSFEVNTSKYKQFITNEINEL